MASFKLITVSAGIKSLVSAVTSSAGSVDSGKLVALNPAGIVDPTSRVAKNTVASSATPSINTDTTNYFSITALAVAITGFTLSGTPIDGQTLWISIIDNGTARALTFGASFEASTIALPTTTVVSTRLDVGFVWNAVTSKWRCVAVA